MTDAEKLEEWYRKNGILKGIEFHFANIYDDYYIQELEEPMFWGAHQYIRLKKMISYLFKEMNMNTFYGCMRVPRSKSSRKKYQTS